MVEWRPIPGYEAYEASELGEIRPVKPRYRNGRGSKIKPWIVSRHGRHAAYVSLHIAGKRTKHLVHRLVCLAFHGEPGPDQTDCCHKNHDPLDNRASNLRWGTHQENMAENIERSERSAQELEELMHYGGPGMLEGTPF